jgi:hypothetical protein
VVFQLRMVMFWYMGMETIRLSWLCAALLVSLEK